MRTMRETELEWELHKANRRIAEFEHSTTHPLTWEDTECKTTIVDTKDLPMVARVHAFDKGVQWQVRLETFNQPKNIALGYYIDKTVMYSMHHLTYMLADMHEDVMQQLVRYYSEHEK